ncbi:adenylate/guanylate cyclase domain-containing protein [Actinokineospora cianjurensis]|uniref:Class 3 adenylate cyclase n=1 Tax=Actinokineospora cianjurensis TaxID=585224 RepID=A0A421B8K5_9PSEU|nr:adenylate/guanylate cyclase domain-containing protein [Actinokineospora cianjurensis]RLK60717.1 hypothetical protein CLV68_1226 [Actinokineospora cianjurensis]
MTDDNSDHPERRATRLPPYRALLVVDIRDFSGLLGRHHAEVTDRVPSVLKAAFERCGLTDVWEGRRFGFSTGDGYAAGFPAEVLPLLLTPFLRALHEELEFWDRVAADAAPLRMRVSVHVGPVTDSGRELLSEGSGVARVEAHRLLDSAPVRDLLTRSGPSTRVAAIVSGRAFTDAVLTGYSGEPPELYVQAPVAVKSYGDLAYLRVPVPTGDLLRHGFLPPVTQAEQPPEVVDHAAGSTGNTAHHVRGDVVQAGRDVNQATNNFSFREPANVNTGSGNQFNGDNAQYHDNRGTR